MYGLWRKPVCFHWRKCVCFILPFTDNREKENSHEYIQCEKCGTRYPIKLDDYSNQINLTILQKAIRDDHIENPEFLG
jgi:hypothetical protein